MLVALLFLAFAAILALVLDGGSAYAARRQAQNAADAGALAGATFMCEYQDATGGANKATEYAMTRNRATSAVANANLSTGYGGGDRHSDRKILSLRGLIGISQICPAGGGRGEVPHRQVGLGIMPVAWSCRETVVAERFYLARMFTRIWS